jgi:hypothetical protein
LMPNGSLGVSGMFRFAREECILSMFAIRVVLVVIISATNPVNLTRVQQFRSHL